MTIQPTLTAAVRQAISTRYGRHATASAIASATASRWLAIAPVLLLLLAATPARSIGLGDVKLNSMLGQPFNASLSILGEDRSDRPGSCYSARLNSADGMFIVAPRIALAPGANGTLLTLASAAPIVEPALSLLVEVGCGSSIRKEYALLLDPPASMAKNLLPVAQSADATGPASVRNRNAAAPGQAAPSKAGAASIDVAPVRPGRTAVPSSSATPTSPVRAAAAAARGINPPPRNVLRLAPRDGSDADLVTAIGLRLALANQLQARTAAEAAVNAGNIPDLARSAANRAAQSRFAAVLRDDPYNDAALQATERKLEQLQGKMQALERDTARLQQAAQSGAAAVASANAAEGRNLGDGWLMILGALLGLSVGAIIWLLVRVRHLKQENRAWTWEDNLSAADGDVAAVEPAAPVADGTAFNGTTSAAPLGQGKLVTSHAPVPVPASYHPPPPPSPTSASTPSLSTPIATPLATPMEFVLDPIVMLPAEDKRGSASTPSASEPPSAPTDTILPPVHDGLQFAEIRMPNAAVEEISDVMQEAEFWISLRDSQRAVEVLEPYATFEQPGSPLPWLYLFDLYRELGQRDKYDTLQERFHRVFNGRVLDWDEQQLAASTGSERSIDDMPHVAQKISTLWHTEQILPYLEGLLIDDRDGTREGFDLSIYREIMFLIGMAYELQQSKKFLKPAIGTPGWTIAA